MLSPISSWVGDRPVILGSNPSSDNVKMGNQFFYISNAPAALNNVWQTEKWKVGHF